MEKNIKEKITEEISSNNVHLFMKGTPLFPQCGFSSTVVQILTYLEVSFSSTNVLEDENLRKKLISHKIFTPIYWPNVLDWSKKDSLEYKITKEIVCLPIDQRYNKEDMKKILKIIL